jgi:hypothetical protein
MLWLLAGIPCTKLVIVLELGTCGAEEPTDWAVACTETFLCKLCRTRGVVRTERTLDCGVSPLVKGALSLLMSPLAVGSSACGDIKPCDAMWWWCSKRWINAAQLSGKNRIIVTMKWCRRRKFDSFQRTLLYAGLPVAR